MAAVGKAFHDAIQRAFVTPDGKMLAVPNSVVINTTVGFLFTNFPSPPLDIPFAVQFRKSGGQGSLHSCYRMLPSEYFRFLMNPPPAVIVTDLNDIQRWHAAPGRLDDERAAYR